MKLIFFRRLILSIVIGAAVTLLVILSGALFLSFRDDPTEGERLIPFIAVALGAAVSGICFCRGEEGSFLPALILSATLTVLFFILSRILSESGSASPLKLPIIAVFSVAGAMVGSKRTASRGSARRRKAVIRHYSR